MKGYWNRPDATAAVLKDGWLHTGDLGYFDSGGNLFITGREKDVIVLSNGKNVYPEEIEAYYLKSPYIKEIGVMALESEPGNPASDRLYARGRARLRRIERTQDRQRQRSDSLRY